MKNPTLKPWLVAQLTWLVMAVLYNAIGIWNIAHGQRALIGDKPEWALIGCLPSAFIIIAGCLNWITVYRCIIPLWIILLASAGLGRHIVAAQTLDGMLIYSSEIAWMSAILINGYGTIVFLGGFLISLNVNPKLVSRKELEVLR